jgi:hypothetical protein
MPWKLTLQTYIMMIVGILMNCFWDRMFWNYGLSNWQRCQGLCLPCPLHTLWLLKPSENWHRLGMISAVRIDIADDVRIFGLLSDWNRIGSVQLVWEISHQTEQNGSLRDEADCNVCPRKAKCLNSLGPYRTMQDPIVLTRIQPFPQPPSQAVPSGPIATPRRSPDPLLLY